MVVFVAVRISFRLPKLYKTKSPLIILFISLEKVSSLIAVRSNIKTRMTRRLAYLVAALVGLRCCAGHTNFKVLKIYVITE